MFNRDLTLIQHPIRLNSSKDLAEMIELAQGRKCWRGLTSQIEKAAEASQTKNWDSKRQLVSKSVSFPSIRHYRDTSCFPFLIFPSHTIPCWCFSSGISLFSISCSRTLVFSSLRVSCQPSFVSSISSTWARPRIFVNISKAWVRPRSRSREVGRLLTRYSRHVISFNCKASTAVRSVSGARSGRRKQSRSCT